MQLDKKINSVTLGGYISSVDTRIGQHGPFGSVTIAIDDGYRDMNNGNAWVDRTQFIRCEVSRRTPLFPVPSVGYSRFRLMHFDTRTPVPRYAVLLSGFHFFPMLLKSL